MLKIWLKLVLKGRCVRKSRPRLKGSLVATRTIVRDWSQFEAFQKNIFIFSIFCRSNLGPPCKLTLDGSC